MTTKPARPNAPRRVTGWLARGLVTAVLGAAAYYGLELADDVLMQRLGENGPAEEVVLIETPDPPATAPRGPSEGVGNGLLRRSVYALERPGGTLSASINQLGWIDGRRVETSGEYHQAGVGPDRRFLLQQTGRLAGEAMRLLRVSDSRFLWTDLAWGANPADAGRRVTRVDLRLVRRAMADGGAAPPASDPAAWSRFGGLPMLVAGLDDAFAFGRPGRMQLGNQVVLAMVGRWRPERIDPLWPDGETPARAPHHVVIALAEATLLPRLVEYRSGDDPLSRPGLSDNALLRPSQRPLLRIALDPRPGAPSIDERMFGYRPNEEGWSDQTDREIALVRSAREATRLARRTR